MGCAPVSCGSAPNQATYDSGPIDATHVTRGRPNVSQNFSFHQSLQISGGESQNSGLCLSSSRLLSLSILYTSDVLPSLLSVRLARLRATCRACAVHVPSAVRMPCAWRGQICRDLNFPLWAPQISTFQSAYCTKNVMELVGASTRASRRSDAQQHREICASLLSNVQHLHQGISNMRLRF